MDIINAIYQLSDKFGLPNQFADLRLFFRALAFQQFWYQGHMRGHTVARQVRLFARQPAGHHFHRRFEALTNLGIEEFLRICLLTGAHMRLDSSPSVYTAAHFDGFKERVGLDRAQLFLDAVSVRLEDLPKRLSDGSTRLPRELWEETPFVDFPFVRIGEEYHCIYREVFQLGMNSFVFDLLKADDCTKFYREFGAVFGRYVGDVLGTSDLPVIGESELQHHLGVDSPVVDHLVIDDDTSIMIEAKGVEVAASGRAAHSQEFLYGKIETSVIRALEQAYGMNERMIALGPKAEGKVAARARNFLIVVTFKEIYVGAGRMLQHLIGTDQLDALRARFPNNERLPIENVVVMCIEDLEYFINAVHTGKVGMREMLERAREADLSATNARFIFSQHLHDAVGNIDPRPPFLARIEDDIYNALGVV